MEERFVQIDCVPARCIAEQRLKVKDLPLASKWGQRWTDIISILVARGWRYKVCRSDWRNFVVAQGWIGIVVWADTWEDGNIGWMNMDVRICGVWNTRVPVLARSKRFGGGKTEG